MNTRRFAIPLIVVTLAIPILAEDEPSKKPTLTQAVTFAKAWVDAQRRYEEIPGMSLAIVHDQNLIWSGGFGMADPASRRPATNDTLYSICSVSKLFTSVAVMQLRDEGKLQLDDPVNKHLTWFTMKPANDSGPVTVRGVLTHSAGLPRESDYPYWTGEFDFPTREKVMERVGKQEALYPASRYYQYSNLGLTLAGEIVAARSGKPYDQFIRERILTPLGLHSTYPEMPEGEKGKRLAQGFSARRRTGDRLPMPFFQARGIAPAAGFASTVDDLARFAMWQFRALAGNDKSVLSAVTLREMQRPHWVDPDFETFWGLGFATFKADGKTFVGHGGSCPGYRTQFLVKPDEKVAVVVMANASGVNIGRYARSVYDIVAPRAKETLPLTPPADPLAPYTGSYDAFPWGGEDLIVAWGDELASISLPEPDPLKAMDRLKKVGEHKFQRVRKDGSLGEVVTFEIGPDGKATRVWWHSNPYPRIAD